MRFTAAISIFTALAFGVSSFAAPTNVDVGTRALAEVAPRHNDGWDGPHKVTSSLPEILDLTHRRVIDIIPDLRAIFPIVRPPKPHPINCERAWHLVSKLNTTIFEGYRSIQDIRHLPFDQISSGLTVSDVAYKAVDLTTIATVAIAAVNFTHIIPEEPVPAPFNLDEILKVIHEIIEGISLVDKAVDEVVNVVEGTVEGVVNVVTEGVNAVVDAGKAVVGFLGGLF
ncbi:hypothetical protein FRB99_004936 [Tulasnella sp. 403]|nr:hypothetical protein FRB99_004936 [Tulasnella sp. 403]